MPKEVVHLKDDYNFRQFEIVSLPSTMEVKRKVNFTSKQNQIAAGTDVVLSDTAHPLTLRFPKVACDLSGRDIDILLDINITLHSNRSGPSNLYPWFLAVYTKRITFTSDMYNAETDVMGHPDNPSSNNSYISYYTVTFRMQYSDTKENVTEYLLSAVDDMDAKGETVQLISGYDSVLYVKDPNYQTYYDISGNNTLWTGKLTSQTTPSSPDHHLGYTMRWFNGMTLKLSQPYWTGSHMFSAFAPYFITASSTEGGSVSDEGEKSVWWKNDKTYMITPKQGYFVKDVIVDGVSVGAVSSYAFPNVTQNHTLHAVFERIMVDVEYDKNAKDAQGDMAPETYGSEQNVPVSECLYSYKGHEFVGWNTKEDGSGDAYSPGDEMSIGEENVRLYAQWREIWRNVTWVDDLTGKIIYEENVLDSYPTKLVSAPEHEGYRLTSVITEEYVASITEDMEFRFVYEQIIYTVTVEFVDAFDGRAVKPTETFKTMFQTPWSVSAFVSDMHELIEESTAIFDAETGKEITIDALFEGEGEDATLLCASSPSSSLHVILRYDSHVDVPSAGGGFSIMLLMITLISVIASVSVSILLCLRRKHMHFGSSVSHSSA